MLSWKKIENETDWFSLFASFTQVSSELTCSISSTIWFTSNFSSPGQFIIQSIWLKKFLSVNYSEGSLIVEFAGLRIQSAAEIWIKQVSLHSQGEFVTLKYKHGFTRTCTNDKELSSTDAMRWKRWKFSETRKDSQCTSMRSENYSNFVKVSISVRIGALDSWIWRVESFWVSHDILKIIKEEWGNC